MDNLELIKESIINGKMDSIKKLIEDAQKKKINPKKIIDDALVPGMNEVSKKWKKNEFFLPDVLLSAAVMQEAMDILKPELLPSDFSYKGIVLIGTVHGDVHDIGKNIVGMMLEGAGFKVIDLGVDVPADKFINEAINNKVDIIGLSALLSSTMTVMKEVVEKVRQSDLKNKVKIIIGGAPVTEEYSKEIGSDGYAQDAAFAVDEVNKLLGFA